MVRSDLRPGSPHMSIFATPTTAWGVVFQRRRSLNATSLNTVGPSTTPPVWLKLARRGTRVYAYYRKTLTSNWTRIGSDTVSSMTGSVRVGLAVSSHVDGRLATANFDNVSLHAVPAWRCADIGAVGVPGTCTGDHVVTTMQGSGADIGGTADAFRFKYTAWSGDGTVVVRVRSIEATDGFSKAGVMFRESTSAGSKHVMLVVSPGKGATLQYRAATGGATTIGFPEGGMAPEWVLLRRTGNEFGASVSDDGVTWRFLDSVTLPMNTSVLVGLPVTSHNNSTLATAVFDDLALYR